MKKLSLLFFSVLFLSSYYSKAQLLSDEELSVQAVFYDIDMALEMPDSVYRLDLSLNTENSKYMDFSTFQYLQELKIYADTINWELLYKQLSELPYFQHLAISGYSITEIPENISKITHLKSLKITYASIKYLPENISELKKLESIEIYYNEIVKFPEGLLKIPNLKEINFSGNKITYIPKDINKLTKLETLNLYSNELYTIPPTLFSLENLKTLNLSENHIPNLPKEIKNLNSLKDLSLSYNELTELPAEIGELSYLTNLDVSYNQLEYLPSTIGNLQNLEFLNVSYNVLKELPPEIGKLKKLMELNFSGNKIQKVPIEITQAEKLESIYCKDNKGIKIPKEIKQLPNLIYFEKDYKFPIKQYKSYDQVVVKLGYHYFDNHGAELGFMLDKNYSMFDFGVYGPSIGSEFYLNTNNELIIGPKIGTELNILLLGVELDLIEYTDFTEHSLHISPGVSFTFLGFVGLNYNYSIPIYNSDFMGKGSKFSVIFNIPFHKIKK